MDEEHGKQDGRPQKDWEKLGDRIGLYLVFFGLGFLCGVLTCLFWGR